MNGIKISGEEMLEAFAEAFLKKLEHMQSQKRRLMNVDAAAEYLGTTESGVYNLVAKGRIKPVRFDGRSRFDVRDLDALIESGKNPE